MGQQPACRIAVSSQDSPETMTAQWGELKLAVRTFLLLLLYYFEPRVE
jgi:hypothetical protein